MKMFDWKSTGKLTLFVLIFLIFICRDFLIIVIGINLSKSIEKFSGNFNIF